MLCSGDIDAVLVVLFPFMYSCGPALIIDTWNCDIEILNTYVVFRITLTLLAGFCCYELIIVLMYVVTQNYTCCKYYQFDCTKITALYFHLIGFIPK